MYIVRSLLAPTKALIEVRSVIFSMEDLSSENILKVLNALENLQSAMRDFNSHQIKLAQSYAILTQLYAGKLEYTNPPSDTSAEFAFFKTLAAFVTPLLETPFTVSEHRLKVHKTRWLKLVECIQGELDEHSRVNHAVENHIRRYLPSGALNLNSINTALTTPDPI